MMVSIAIAVLPGLAVAEWSAHAGTTDRDHRIDRFDTGLERFFTGSLKITPVLYVPVASRIILTFNRTFTIDRLHQVYW